MSGKRKRGRPRKDGPRKHDGSLERGKLIPAPDHIIERRKLFSFAASEKGGSMDQDTCDAIGQFHALGLLDGHPIEGLELRNVGREWRDWFVTLLRKQGFKAGGYERMDKAREKEPRHNERLDRMDDALSGFERHALYSLLIDPVVGSWPLGETDAPWVRATIGEALAVRKRRIAFVRFPTEYERELLKASIRGLFVLHDASLPGRYERRAA
jgi:hypothetical protein